MAEKDYYSILKVSPSATVEEIKTAYKNLALRYHPDRSRDPEATRRMQLVNEAYNVLRDPGQRAAYDELRRSLFSHPIVTTPVDPTPTTPVRVRRARARKPVDSATLRAYIRKQLLLLARLLVVLIGLFIFSLITGKLTWLPVAALIMLSLYIMISIAVKVRG